jgi:hypothetical protein
LVERIDIVPHLSDIASRCRGFADGRGAIDVRDRRLGAFDCGTRNGLPNYISVSEDVGVRKEATGAGEPPQSHISLREHRHG